MNFMTWLRRAFSPRVPLTGRAAKARSTRLRLESLEQRLVPSATIATDQADYPPGSTATIFGAGYQVGETVQMKVEHLDTIYHHHYAPWNVTDGDATPAHADGLGVLHLPDLDGKVDGSIQTTWQVGNIPHSLLQATGTGLSSREVATTTFTDGTPTSFSNLSSPTITYGTATTTISGTILGGGVAPSGIVTITINSVSNPAPIDSITGAFSFNFNTQTLPVAAPYTITYNYAGDGVFDPVNDISKTLTVTKKVLTVAGITANNKIYDGTAAAVISTSGATLVGVLPADSLNVSLNTAGATGAFADKNIGGGKTVTVSGLSLTGSASGNYTLTASSATTVADIAAVTLTGSVTAANKIYDGNTAATITGRTLSAGVVAGDSVSLSGGTATFADQNVGTAKTVTVTGLALSGADAGNYILPTTVASTTANIAARAITVSAEAKSKIVGAPDPALTFQVTSGSLVGGDSFSGSLTRAVGQTVGTYPILQGTLTAGSNYALSYIGANFTILSGAAARLRFATQPVNTVAGQPMQLAVQLTDGGGNAVRQAGVAVTLRISSGRFFPAGSGTGVIQVTLLTDASGQVVLDGFTIKTIGKYRFTASAVFGTTRVNQVSNLFSILPDKVTPQRRLV